MNLLTWTLIVLYILTSFIPWALPLIMSTLNMAKGDLREPREKESRTKEP